MISDLPRMVRRCPAASNQILRHRRDALDRALLRLRQHHHLVEGEHIAQRSDDDRERIVIAFDTGQRFQSANEQLGMPGLRAAWSLSRHGKIGVSRSSPVLSILDDRSNATSNAMAE